MEGWELDAEIIPVARAYMGLKMLEDCGALVCISHNPKATVQYTVPL